MSWVLSNLYCNSSILDNISSIFSMLNLKRNPSSIESWVLEAILSMEAPIVTTPAIFTIILFGIPIDWGWDYYPSRDTNQLGVVTKIVTLANATEWAPGFLNDGKKEKDEKLQRRKESSKEKKKTERRNKNLVYNSVLYCRFDNLPSYTDKCSN